MPEPLTFLLGGYLLGLARDALVDIPKTKLSNTVKATADKFWAETLFNSESNDDIRRALQAAYTQALTQIFSLYEARVRTTPLSYGQWQEAKPKAKELLTQKIAEQIFPAVYHPRATLDTTDVTALFTASRESVQAGLIDTVKNLPAWKDMPTELQKEVGDKLLDSLTYNFAQVAIKSDPKARDSLFFQQLISLQKATGAAEGRLSEFRSDVLSAFAKLEAYQSWQRLLLENISAVGEHIDEALAQYSEHLKEIIKLLKDGGRITDGSVPIQVRHRSVFDKILSEHQLFGGRHKAQADIAKFIAGPGGYFFIKGSSGYGKTALLAHLVNSDRNLFQYHFFSRRYGFVNEREFFENITQQLLACHRLGGQLPQSDIEMRALCIQLLQTPAPIGQPIYIVIDALDEASDTFSLSPYFVKPGAGVHILFSARPVANQDWLGDLKLKELGLRPDELIEFELERMGQSEISELLREAAPETSPLAEDAEALTELELATEGDPFFLRVLIGDFLQDPVKARKELRELAQFVKSAPASPTVSAHRGLRQYLKTWWEELYAQIGKGEVDDLLGYLAVARGPITRQDLISIDDSDNLRGLNIDQALKATRRFVTGDEESGYTMGHPRFQAYVAERIGGDRQRYRQSVLAYCLKWREHESSYALRNLAGHLADDNQWEALHQLLAVGGDTLDFAEKRNSRDGSYSGYIGDLESAWARANRFGAHDPKSISRQIRYVLIISSLHSLALNITAPLLSRLVETGLWKVGPALDHARAIPRPEERAGALLEMAQYFQGDARNRILREAARVRAKDRGLFGTSLRLMKHVLPRLSGEALMDAAETAKAIEEPLERAFALILVAKSPLPIGAKLRVLHNALEAARSFVETVGKGVDQVAVMARTIEMLDERAKSCERLSGATSQGNESTRLIQELQDNLCRLFVQSCRVEGLDEFVLPALVEFFEPGLLHELLEIIRSPAPVIALRINQSKLLNERAQKGLDQYSRARALATLIPYLAESQLPEGFEVAQLLEPSGRGECGLQLLKRLPREKHTSLFLKQTLEDLLSSYYENETQLSQLAHYLDEPERSKAIAEGLSGAREGLQFGWGLMTFASVVSNLPESVRSEALLCEVLEATKDVDIEDERGQVLGTLAPHLNRTLIQRALDLAQAILDRRQMVEALTALAGLLPDSERKQRILSIAIEEIRAIKHGLVQQLLIVPLTSILPHALQLEVLDIAQKITESESGEIAVASVTRSLALSDSGQAVAKDLTDHFPAERASVTNRSDLLRDEVLRKAESTGQNIEHVILESFARSESDNRDSTSMDTWARNDAQATLIIMLAEFGFTDQALAKVKVLDETYHRTRALCGLTFFVQGAERLRLLREALEIIWNIDNPHGDRDFVMKEVIEPLRLTPRPELYPLWEETVHVLAARTRQNLLTDLRVLIPVIHCLGGTEALEEMADAILDVRRWWP